MAIYFDASVIVSMLMQEPTSERVSALFQRQGETFVISDFASAEVSSAISRHVRMRLETTGSASGRLQALDRLKLRLRPTVVLEPDDIRVAEAMVRTFELKLRTPDAIHAAVCLRHNYQLATLDMGLADAARLLGVACINPADEIGEQKN